MSKFKGLCKALAGFDYTGAKQVRVIFYDTSLGFEDASCWIRLLNVAIDEDSGVLSASAWDDLLDKLPRLARQTGAFDLDMERIPIGGPIPPAEGRRINMGTFFRNIDQLKRIYAVLWMDDDEFSYGIRFSSDTGLPDRVLIRSRKGDDCGDNVAFLSGSERKEIRTFETVRAHF